MHKKTRKKLTIIAVVFTWLTLGVMLGLAGFLLIGHIPIFALGIFLALLGALLHSVFIIFNVRLAWWKVGALLAVPLSSYQIIGGIMAGDHFTIKIMAMFFAYNFIFGVMFYLFIQKGIVDLMTNDN